MKTASEARDNESKPMLSREATNETTERDDGTTTERRRRRGKTCGVYEGDPVSSYFWPACKVAAESDTPTSGLPLLPRPSPFSNIDRALITD